jgi:hypothetical protein
MSLGELRWGIFRRMCSWGIGAGVVCGGFYGTILAPLIGTIIGAIIGGGMGFALGILNGFYLSNVTAIYYYPLLNFKDYQRAMAVQCALVTIIGAAIMMAIITYGLWLRTISTQSLGFLPICVIIPAFIAGIAAIAISWDVTDWYKMKLDRANLRDDWE